MLLRLRLEEHRGLPQRCHIDEQVLVKKRPFPDVLTSDLVAAQLVKRKPVVVERGRF